MRYVWAVAAFVLATLLIGAGIAQGTIFKGPESDKTEVSIAEPERFVLIDGSVLRHHAGEQSLRIRGEGTIFAAQGRTADIEAWLSDSSYNAITISDEGELVSEVVEPTASEVPAEGETAPAVPTAGRNPAGSDLWLDSFTEQDALSTDTPLPEGMSLLVATDGTAAAPGDITLSWPLDNSTPLAGPLMSAGAVALLIGLVMYILGIRHQRRGRGPRRKGPPPLPPTEPIDLAVDRAPERPALTGASGGYQGAAPEHGQTDPNATQPSSGSDAPGSEGTSGKAERRAARPARKRRLLAIPAVGLSIALFAGCSADSWPQFAEETPTPTPTPTVVAPDNQKPPAVTEGQAQRIVESISATIADADATMNIDTAATRLDGAALEGRRAEYRLRTAIPERTAPAAIPTENIEIVLPQANDAWPRTVLVLASSGEDTVPPVILTMTQADPWAPYKVSNLAEMQASAELPELAPAWLGTALVPPDLAFLTTAPNELAAAFADIVDNGEASTSYALFDELSQALARSVQESRQTVVNTLSANGASETSTAAFDATATDREPVSLATLDSGAIVAVSMTDSEAITPTSADAVIRFGENAAAKALTGVTESAKGVQTTYGFQLFFSVPAQGSTEPITLLAVHQDLLDIKLIE